jgi:hypothetical protein
LSFGLGSKTILRRLVFINLSLAISILPLC